MRPRIVNIVLWLAFLLAMLASLSHVATTFNTLELPGHTVTGWLAGIAVDAGLASLAYAIQQRRRAKRPVLTLWLGVFMFAIISGYANVLYSLSVDGTSIIKAIILSATLPLLVLYLGEVVSSDDVAAAQAAEREQRRQEREQEREAMREEVARQKADLELQKQELYKKQVNDRLAEKSRTTCTICSRAFASYRALNGHKKAHGLKGRAAREAGAGAAPA